QPASDWVKLRASGSEQQPVEVPYWSQPEGTVKVQVGPRSWLRSALASLPDSVPSLAATGLAQVSPPPPAQVRHPALARPPREQQHRARVRVEAFLEAFRSSARLAALYFWPRDPKVFAAAGLARS